MIYILDLDGTLIDSSERHWILVELLTKEQMPQLELNKKDYFISKKNGLNNKNFLKKYIKDDEIINKIQLKWIDLIETKELVKYDKLYYDTIPFLEKIKKNTIYFLTSRQNKKITKDSIKKLNINRYCKKLIVVDPKDSSNKKAKEINKLKKINKRIIVVGDSEIDFFAAKKAAVENYILNRGFRCKSYLKKNGIKSYNNLEEIYERIVNEKL